MERLEIIYKGIDGEFYTQQAVNLITFKHKYMADAFTPMHYIDVAKEAESLEDINTVEDIIKTLTWDAE